LKKYNVKELEQFRVLELRSLCKKNGLIGYSQLRKADLVHRLDIYFRKQDSVEERVSKRAGTGSRDDIKKAISLSDKVSVADTTSSPVTEAEPAPAPTPESGDMRDAAWYPPEIPDEYHIDRLTLMVRDPRCLFCYWEINAELLASIKGKIKDASWTVLRVQVVDLEGIVTDTWDYSLPEGVRDWYIHANRPGASFRAELGLCDSTGNFTSLVASNTVQVPAEAPSPNWDEEWIGLSRETWEQLEKVTRSFPGSMGGQNVSAWELRHMAAARLGGSENSAFPKARKEFNN
jgi:uncharacterized protein